MSQTELGHDASRVSRCGQNTTAFESLPQAEGKQDIRSFGGAVRGFVVVGILGERFGSGLFGPPQVRETREVDDTSAFTKVLELVHEASGEPEVSKMVDAPLLFDALLGGLVGWQRHDSCVVHQVLELEPSRKERCHEFVDGRKAAKVHLHALQSTTAGLQFARAGRQTLN